MADDDGGSKLLWFVAGTAVGASVALLFAPASGKHTRKLLAKKTEEGRSVLAESGRDMFERGKEMFERGRKLADEAADMFERGRKLVEGTTDKLQKAVS